MREPIIPRDQAASHLDVPARLLLRLERRGLVRAVREGQVEGYEPSELRRLWSIVSLHREAGINLAGIEAILRLRERFDELYARMDTLARALREYIDTELEPQASDDV